MSYSLILFLQNTRKYDLKYGGIDKVRNDSLHRLLPKGIKTIKLVWFSDLSDMKLRTSTTILAFRRCVAEIYLETNKKTTNLTKPIILRRHDRPDIENAG